MAEAHLKQADEQSASTSESATVSSSPDMPEPDLGEGEYADASHWMHSVSADDTDHAESGGKLDLTDIDLSAIKEDEVVPDKGTAHSLGRKLNIVLCALAFFVLFGYLFIAGEGEDTIRALTSFNWAFLLLAFAGIVVYWLLEALSMQIICNSLFKGFSFIKTFIVTIIGQYFNCITPLSSGGQPMQAYYYSRFGLPLKHAMPMLLCRFIVYQLTMTVYAIIVLILRFNYFMQDLRAIMYLVAIGFVGGFVLIAMLFSLAFAKNGVIRVVTWIINLLGRIGILKHPESTLANATKSLEEAYSGIRFLLNQPAILVKVSLVTFVQLTVYFSLSWVIFAGFGLDFEKLGMDPVEGYFTVISCQAFVYLIASFVPLPGAIGASEASYITFFNYVYKDPSVVALSTFIWRAFTFYLPIVLGMVLTLMVNNENSMLSRWLRKDDARMAFTDHTVTPKEKKPKRGKHGKKDETAGEPSAAEGTAGAPDIGAVAGVAIGAGTVAAAEVDAAASGAAVEAAAVADVAEDVPAAEAVMADEDIAIEGPDGEAISVEGNARPETVAQGVPDETEPEEAEAVVDDAMVALGGVEISKEHSNLVAEPIA